MTSSPQRRSATFLCPRSIQDVNPSPSVRITLSSHFRQISLSRRHPEKEHFFSAWDFFFFFKLMSGFDIISNQSLVETKALRLVPRDYDGIFFLFTRVQQHNIWMEERSASSAPLNDPFCSTPPTQTATTEFQYSDFTRKSLKEREMSCPPYLPMNIKIEKKRDDFGLDIWRCQ